MRILGFKKKMSNIFNCTISGVVVSVLIIITASSPSSGSQTVSDECVRVLCSYDVWEVLFLSKSLILTRHIQITGHRQQNCHKEYCPVSAMYGEIADCCNLLFGLYPKSLDMRCWKKCVKCVPTVRKMSCCSCWQ